MSEIQKAERLGNLIFEIIPICEEKEANLADKHGLFEAEFRCLRLFGVDENLNNKEIAKKMKLSESRLTRITDGLVKKGYMKREIDMSDRRQMKLSLSRRGKMLTNKLNNEFVNIHSEILLGIDASQHESLITTMEQLNSAVEKWLQKPRI
jgi:DNA-binding MarR family transcriptional regulator